MAHEGMKCLLCGGDLCCHEQGFVIETGEEFVDVDFD